MKKADLIMFKFCPFSESIVKPPYFICDDITVVATPWTVMQKIVR
jgi:hypothetical protein